MRAPRLFEELTLCHADGSFRKRLATIAKISVLIIDDFASPQSDPEKAMICSSWSTIASGRNPRS